MLRVRPSRSNERLPWGLAWRLAAGQVIAWGVLYYAFTVVVGPLQAETGWAKPFVQGGVSLGLLTWGLCAIPAGRWLQRRGARGLMTVASVLGGGALAMIGATSSKGVFLVGWTLLGASMAGLLYEPAFAVVVEHFGARYRRGIMLVTFVGGLASTMFIPLAQFAVDAFGWRAAIVGLAMLHIGVCAPVHGFGIPRRSESTRPAAAVAAASVRVGITRGCCVLRLGFRDTRMIGLAVWFSAQAASLSGLIFILVPMLQGAGIPRGTMLQALALIGPMQVLGRHAMAVCGDRFDALQIGLWATIVLGISLAVLIILPPAGSALIAFAFLFGVGNGVMTILRGTVVAELFGRERYAELNGAIALPSMVAKASSPLALAFVWSATGSAQATFVGSLLMLALSAVGLSIARRGWTSDAKDSTNDSKDVRRDQRAVAVVLR